MQETHKTKWKRKSRAKPGARRGRQATGRQAGRLISLRVAPQSREAMRERARLAGLSLSRWVSDYFLPEAQ